MKSDILSLYPCDDKSSKLTMRRDPTRKSVTLHVSWNSLGRKKLFL